MVSISDIYDKNCSFKVYDIYLLLEPSSCFLSYIINTIENIKHTLQCFYYVTSGAGKTTLLAAISRRDKSALTGYLMLNGRLAGADLIARISGFLPQEDLSIDDLTVTEHMEFMVS